MSKFASATAKFRVWAVAFFFLSSLGVVALNASAATLPIAGAGAKFFVNFTNPQAGKVLFVGVVPGAPGLVYQGLAVTVTIGPTTRNYTLGPLGQANAPASFFELHAVPTGYAFSLDADANNLLNNFGSIGIVNQNETNAAVSLDASIAFNSDTYTTTMPGVYDAIAGKVGKAFFGIIKPPKDPFKPVVKITTINARPNPAAVNQTVTVKGGFNLASLTGPVAGNLFWGDGTAAIHVTGDVLQKMLSQGIEHQYAATGVFVVRISFVGAEEIAETRIYALVGPGYDLNSINGGYTHLMKQSSGAFEFEIGIDNIPGAANAMTAFFDLKGNPTGTVPSLGTAGARTNITQSGTDVSIQFSLPGIYHSESLVLDDSDNVLGTLRKTIVVTAADIGSLSAETRDENDDTDSAITLTNMKGSFKFTSSNLDKVVFNGTVSLPAGYTPKAITGNDITMSMGNVTDTVHLDSKNRLELPTATSVITHFHLTPPRLPTGVAVGGETARVSITMNVADLDVKGFDTEGITVDVRDDEEGESSVARFIQVEMLIGGQSYSVLAPVSYSVAGSGDFGTFSGAKSELKKERKGRRHRSCRRRSASLI